MTTKILGVAFALMLAFISMGAQPASASHLRTGAYATTTSSLNLRSGAGTGYRIYRTIPYGARVWVHYKVNNSHWYNVTYSGTRGFVLGTYLTQGSGGTTSSSGSSSKGQAIANTAKAYVGYRYAYYGNTPSEGFSCVGLTQWAYRQNGIWIPESLGGQASSGWSVSRGNLRAGDIVLFQNTWWNGLSHAGIYVGNGWMVNAVSPQYGIRWDNIYNSYYSGKWYDGRRLVN
ncbi:MAG: NlpC/P60 family protein [Chloroflexota bacterium]|nr:NlpC/P60 family protein [Chloroflexota bacterium]